MGLFQAKIQKNVNFPKLLAFAKLQWEERSAGTKPDSFLQHYNYKQITPVSRHSFSTAVIFQLVIFSCNFKRSATSPANTRLPKLSVTLSFAAVSEER